MTDLVQRIIDIYAPGDDWPGHKKVAEKIVAAVLDDLMADSVLERQEWHAVHKWLASKRAGLGLTSPVEPQDAPKPSLREQWRGKF